MIFVEFLYEIHKGLPREGPGNNESTRKAFSMMKNFPANPKILDVGCGPGMQTIELAKISGGTITAVDNHKPYLEQLRQSAKKEGVGDQIQTINVSMYSLDFEEKSFDLIWAEGSAYIMGFLLGLRLWRRFLKLGGYYGVTELTWLKDNPTKKINNYFRKEYPAMKTIEGNIEGIFSTGLDLQDYFILPEASWWDFYYTPLESRIATLREKYKDKGNEKMNEELDESQREIDLYRKYSKYYGYVFYIVQNNSYDLRFYMEEEKYKSELDKHKKYLKSKNQH